MDAKIRARHQARAKILKALAHPTRLFIVEELVGGEKCVCELQEMIGADMSTVSKHLAQTTSVVPRSSTRFGQPASPDSSIASRTS